MIHTKGVQSWPKIVLYLLGYNETRNLKAEQTVRNLIYTNFIHRTTCDKMNFCSKCTAPTTRLTCRLVQLLSWLIRAAHSTDHQGISRAI